MGASSTKLRTISKGKAMTENIKKPSRSERFVQYVCDLCRSDSATSAALRRSDRPSLEYQSWGILINFGVDLDKPWERAAFTTIGAAVAQEGAEKNGTVAIMRALAQVYEKNLPPAERRLRRLLACQSTQECCQVLHPLFKLLRSKSSMSIDYARLLDELLQFHSNTEQVRIRWATDFYPKENKE